MTSKRSCKTNMKRSLPRSLRELGTAALCSLRVKSNSNTKYTIDFCFNLFHTVNGITEDSTTHSTCKAIDSFANPLSKARTASILMMRRLSSESSIFSKISAYEEFSS